MPPTRCATARSTSSVRSPSAVGCRTSRGSARALRSVVEQALAGDVPEYLARLEAEAAPDSGPGAEIRAALAGDLHLHSDWSDGGATIESMARKAAELGHRYMALTDHSPQLKVAHGLTRDRLLEQLEVVTRVNEELAPFRVLTGIEVDILDDGSLDQDDDLLAELDVVVASVHSKLRMPEQPMTDRMVAAMANPHADILGHCTGRLVLGRGRPESTFDPDARVRRLRPLRQGGRDQLPAGAARPTDAPARDRRHQRLQGVDRQRRPRGGTARVAAVRLCTRRRVRRLAGPHRQHVAGGAAARLDRVARRARRVISTSSRAGTGERTAPRSGIKVP